MVGLKLLGCGSGSDPDPGSEGSVLCAGKNRRLKQAKEEAQAEIEQYRLQREKEFKTKEAAVSRF